MQSRETEVLALILAAGGSRRLGRPKQLVQVEGEPMLARVIRVAHAAGAQPVFVVLGAEMAQIQAGVDLSHARIVFNERWGQGIAGSIHAGLSAIEQTCSTAAGVLIVSCDQPCLTAEHLRSMLAMFHQHDAQRIVASAYAETLGVPVIFPRSHFEKLYELEGDRGARALLHESANTVIQILLPGGEIDIDTPEDLRYIE